MQGECGHACDMDGTNHPHHRGLSSTRCIHHRWTGGADVSLMVPLVLFLHNSILAQPILLSILCQAEHLRHEVPVFLHHLLPTFHQNVRMWISGCPGHRGVWGWCRPGTVVEVDHGASGGGTSVVWRSAWYYIKTSRYINFICILRIYSFFYTFYHFWTISREPPRPRPERSSTFSLQSHNQNSV